MKERLCTVCGKALKGRSDKKFCSTSCKNKFNYPASRMRDDIVRDVNRFLLKNRRVLENIFADEKENKLMVPRLLLEKMGFHFNYHTGSYINHAGKMYHYVYEFSWMEFSSQEIMLLRPKKKIKKN